MSTFLRFAALAVLAFAGTGAVARAEDEEVDPPSRVARLSYLRGDVSFSPAGESDWVVANINRPLIHGDRLWTDRGGRAELQLGSASLRLDDGTSLQLLNLDDRTVQVEVTEGTLNLRVRRLYQDQVYEVDTPTLAFTVTRPGEYRIDVDTEGKHTTVAVWDGGGVAYGENANFPVRESEAIRFFDPELRDYEVFDIPRADDFDRFCQTRDEGMDRSTALKYVPEDMVGYSDLDEYGTWDTVSDYGAVWYPTHISAGWAPYRDGHWIWQEPWGWTWVDTAPWGFAPFHYGRWAYVGTRWGWVPGPIRSRPVYSPALVGFVGGNHWGIGVGLGGPVPVGWFPLGPREVYCPPYRVSRGYFTNVNVTNTVINNTYITTVYNDYSNGRSLNSVNYAYRSNPAALSAVPGNVFANARPVNGALIRMDRDMATRAEVMRVAAVTPVQRSVLGPNAAASAIPQRAVLERGVVARNAPAPTIGSFASREQALQRNAGRPLEPSAVVNTGTNAQRGRGDVPQRVRVVGTDNAVNARTQAPIAGRGNTGRDTAVTERGGAPRSDQPVLRTNPDAGDRGRGNANADAARNAQNQRGDTQERGVGSRDISRPAAHSDGLPSRDYRNNAGNRGDAAAPADRTIRNGGNERQPTTTRSAEPVLRTAPTQPTQPTRVEPQRQTEIRRSEPAVDRSSHEDRAQRQPEVRRAEPVERAQPQRVERAQPQPEMRRAEPVERAAPQREDRVQRQPEVRRDDAPQRAVVQPVPQQRAEPRAAPRNDDAPKHEHKKKDDN
jgi:hypothetical protein